MACRDCRKCTNSGLANLGRNTARATIGIMTAGVSELALKTRRQCRSCGHQMSLHDRIDTAQNVRAHIIT